MPQLLSVSQRASGTRGNYDETALDKTEEEKKTLDKTKQKIELQEYLGKGSEKKHRIFYGLLPNRGAGGQRG